MVQVEHENLLVIIWLKQVQHSSYRTYT
jgi:hypothetical protein